MSDVKRIKAKTTYKFRGDTAENWEKLNPVLSAREPGLIIDENGKTVAFKIGDGATAWNDLELHNIDGGGGGSLDVDQIYNPESENAQSGIAVAEVLNTKMDKTGSVITGGEKIQLSHIVEDDYGVEYSASINVDKDGITLSAPSSFYSGVAIIGNRVEICSSFFGTHIHGNETYENSKVRIEDLVEPTKDGDAVNLGYLNAQLDGIETALDSIISIQNELIGGDGV